MNKQTFVQVATCVFAVVGLVHVYRYVQGFPVLFNTYLVPLEASLVVGAAALLLAYAGYRHWR